MNKRPQKMNKRTTFQDIRKNNSMHIIDRLCLNIYN
jgi:hypothetical protein